MILKPPEWKQGNYARFAYIDSLNKRRFFGSKLVERNCVQFYLIFAIKEKDKPQLNYLVKYFNFSMRCSFCPASLCSWHVNRKTIYAWVLHCSIVNRGIVYREIAQPIELLTPWFPAAGGETNQPGFLWFGFFIIKIC